MGACSLLESYVFIWVFGLFSVAHLAHLLPEAYCRPYPLLLLLEGGGCGPPRKRLAPKGVSQKALGAVALSLGMRPGDPASIYIPLNR